MRRHNIPLELKQEPQPIHGPRQENPTHEHDHEQNIRKQRRKYNNLTRSLDPSCNYPVTYPYAHQIEEEQRPIYSLKLVDRVR
jgi:hypothetical protein